MVDGGPAVGRPVLETLPAGWPLVHLERPPLGVADAFNQALAAARGTYVWFLNGGDALREPAALSRMLALLDDDPALDLVCGGAYLYRNGRALYPMGPRPTLLANLVGRSWMCQQAVIYRRASLERVGTFSTAYRATGDYDFHIRCYVTGLRGRFTTELLVDYDMGGGSNDIVPVFAELKRIQRSHRKALPLWVNGLNEVVRTFEHARILTLRGLAATPIGGRLRPVWARLNRWVRPRRMPLAR